MQDYRGNSDKLKEAKDVKTEKSLEKVVEGEVIIRKPSIGTRLKGVLFGADFKQTGVYVLTDVVLPAVRDLVVESFSKGVDRLIYGDSAPRNHRAPTNYGGRVAYHNPSAQRGAHRALLPDQPRRWPTAGRRPFEAVILSSRSEAESLIDAITTVVDQYEIFSLADLYDLLGEESHPYTDNKWGWTQLGTVDIRQTRDGWQLMLPPLEEL